MTVRTLFIGMDGATFTVLDDLITAKDGQEAVMPFLGSLMARGVRSPLRSTPNPLTPPAWVSLMTGRTPGNHGVFDFIRAEERGEDVFFTLYDSRDNRAETIWSIASRQGKKVAVLNLPFTAPPPKDLNGFMVPGFIPWRHLRRNTVPADFYDRLKTSLPDFEPKELAWDFEQEKQAVDHLSDEDRENWVRYHLPREKQWFHIAELLIKEEAPDLMAVMFDGVDKLQHQAWLFLDPNLQQGSQCEYHQRMRALCLDYFRQLDGFIEALVSAAGPEAQVFLASDHGFTVTTKLVRINAYLHDKGYLDWKAMPDTDAAKRREDSFFSNLDWKKTTAYCRTPSSNGIHIRVAYNPGDSGIRPEDYMGFREQLIQDLKALTDPVTGEAIITEVHKREDVFSGPAMLDAPDLLLVLCDYGFVSIKNKYPVVEQRSEPAGTHHPDGVFIAAGPGIRKGVKIERRNIVDVGATLLYSVGLPVPEDFEGRVPDQAFTKPWLLQNPIVQGAASLDRTGNSTDGGMGEEEKEKLMAQLKMLGYLE